MKALWIVLAILGVVILSCVGGVFFLTRSIAGVNDAADRYATETLTLTAADWKADVLRARFSDIAKAEWPGDKLDSYLSEKGRKLGALKVPPEFRSFEFKVESKNGVSGAHVATRTLAQFEKGSAVVIFRLRKTGDVWKVDYFAMSES